jgi:hypothetical protein
MRDGRQPACPAALSSGSNSSAPDCSAYSSQLSMGERCVRDATV